MSDHDETKQESEKGAGTPKVRRPRARRMPDLWGVVRKPDGSTEAYTFITKAIHIAGEAGVKEVELCRISPKSRGFKVVERMQVG